MKEILLLSLLLCVTVVQGSAQGHTVTGKVTSAEDGSSLPGVNVVLKGTTKGTVTDADGQYSLALPSGEGTLIFSFIGLASREESVAGRNVIDVQMATDVKQLAEVVITGYGEVSKEAFTGSHTRLDAAMIESQPVSSVESVLQGNIAGLQLTTSSGTPGSVQDIRIRGISSITANNEPLFVIDGIPVISGNMVESTSTGTLGVLASINANDIESMTVLKDASATALYGARAANGVIIITTKTGKSGKAQFNFSAQRGWVSRAVDGPKMLNAAQWEELYLESLVNAGYASTPEEANELYPSGWDGTTDTDWWDVITNDDAMQQSYDISARGGNEKFNYYSSVGYFQQDGVNLGTDYERITGKLNFSSAVNDKLLLSNATTGSHILQNGQLEGSAYFSNPEAAPLFTLPIDPATNPDGTPNLNLSTGTYNPLFVYENDIDRRNQVRILNNTTLRYDILDNLKFTTNIGLDYVQTEELYYNNRTYGDGAGSNGSSFVYSNRNFNWVWKNMLDYSLSINETNDLGLKFIYEAQKNQYYTIGAGGNDIAADGLHYPSSVGNVTFANGYKYDWAVNSIAGVVNYAFDSRVFVDATLRGEGNSRFSADNRWGLFYSLGASWVLSNESFLDGVEALDNAKLRVSYGKTGNGGIGVNQYQAFLGYDYTYNGAGAIAPNQFGNYDLTWETSKAWNFALDLGLFERITTTVEYFHRTGSDLLLEVPLSYTTGFDQQLQNVGEMVNKGVEVSFSADIFKTRSFKWNVGFNLTSLSNEVTKLPTSATGEEIGITTNTRTVATGLPVYSWSMPTWMGVNPQTGQPQWLEADNSEAVTSVYNGNADYYQGANATPTFYGGLNTRLEYKGVFLTALLYYSTGNKLYDTWAGYTLSDGRFTYNVSSGYARTFDRWQKPGDISDNPQNIYGNTSQSNQTSSRRLYDGEYLRLRDLTVGYNFPASLLSKMRLSSATLYVKGTNLWTWVKDDNLEFDPEVKADGFIDLNSAPLKNIAVGLKVGF